MSTCFVCANAIFSELPMTDEDVLEQVARQVVQGMTSTLHSGDSLKNFMPPRRGICVVERCARTVEEPCGACRQATCQRCLIAAELRSAQDHINAERDAELVTLVHDGDLERIVDNLAESLCRDHVAFGGALVKEWYGRRDLRDAPAPFVLRSE